MPETAKLDHLSAHGCAAPLHISISTSSSSKGEPDRVERISAELGRLVQSYQKNGALKLAGDLDGFRMLEDKPEAVRRAAGGLYSDGQKKREHQYRLSNELLSEVALSINFEELVSHVADFKALNEYLYVVCRCKGYADLTIHDAALHIYAALNKYRAIDVVYLHRGAGWGFASLQRILPHKMKVLKDKNGCRYVMRSDFPQPISQLMGEQIENFLCNYRKELAAI